MKNILHVENYHVREQVSCLCAWFCFSLSSHEIYLQFLCIDLHHYYSYYII